MQNKSFQNMLKLVIAFGTVGVKTEFDLHIKQKMASLLTTVTTNA